MPAIVRTEFALALNQVATERGIDPAVVIDSIKAAILAAYRKDYGADIIIEELQVELNPDTGEAKILHGDKDITPPGFGRIAAQTAKQVILQRIREAEKQAILTDFSAKVGSIVPGMILRFDGPNIVVDIGRSQAIMPPQEQIPSERYRLNQRLPFFIEGIRETYRGNEIVVSRANKGLVSGLFKREVPEVAQGAVEIREIAREPGSRTKIAVISTQAGVDPVGSCVGQKGVRVQAVIGELGGEEKIDIIQWSDDPLQYIIAALSPAKDLSVKLNETTKSAEVTLPEDQLSLAIGREGQNVRLAAKLTGWKIDLKGKPSLKTLPLEAIPTPESKEEIKPKEEPAVVAPTVPKQPAAVVAETPAVNPPANPQPAPTGDSARQTAAPVVTPPDTKAEEKVADVTAQVEVPAKTVPTPVTASPEEVVSNVKSTDEAGAAPTTAEAVKDANAPVQPAVSETPATDNTPAMEATEATAPGAQSSNSAKTDQPADENQPK